MLAYLVVLLVGSAAAESDPGADPVHLAAAGYGPAAAYAPVAAHVPYCANGG